MILLDFDLLLALICVSSSEPLFSSKSAYYPNEDTKNPFPSECAVNGLFSVFRHGTRYPSKKDVRKIRDLRQFMSIYSESDVVHPFQSSPLPYDESQDKALAQQGNDELYLIGRRTAERFSVASSSSASNHSFLFASTCKERSEMSAKAFSRGLLADELGGTVKVFPCEDTILRFFDSCKRYSEQVENNRSALAQLALFENTTYFHDTLSRLTRSAALKPGYKFSPGLAHALWLACAYNVSLFRGSTDEGVCALFSQEDFSVMEYYYDLKNFYKRGYGYDINVRMACPLLRNLLDHVEAGGPCEGAVRNIDGVFLFAHAETIIPVVQLMGLFKDDEALTADNYARVRQRKFRAGLFASFASNVMFASACCGGDRKVIVLLNERPVRLPCCKETVCSLDELRVCYSAIVGSCNLEAICKVPTDGHPDL